MTLLYFTAAVLSTYCISLFVSKLSGPGGVFSKLRKESKGGTKEWLTCPLCLGWSVSVLVIGYLYWLGLIPLTEAPLWVFSVAGANALAHLLDGF